MIFDRQNREPASLSRLEWLTGAALTVLLFWIHLLALRASGALWRDEANTVAIATLPKLSDVWTHLHFDSFPVLWILITRVYASIVGPMNDQAFRILSFSISLGVIASLWFFARTLRFSVPLLSLSLFALSPGFVRFGDTIRAYGIGVAATVLAGCTIWRLIEKPTVRRFVIATIVATASVHLLFYNAVTLLAFSSGGIVVALIRRERKTVVPILAVGAIAAASLIPYRSMIANAAEWQSLVRIPDYSLSFFWARFGETVNVAGKWARWVWAFAFSGSVLAGLTIFTRWRDVQPKARETIVFALVAMIVGVTANIAFLEILSYVTAPWYYFTLMVIVAVCADAILGLIAVGRIPRLIRIAAMMLVAGLAIIPARRAAKTRLTDADVVASILDTTAKPGDLIVVMPWHDGITFQRYYKGPVAWVTVPPLAEHSVHRYDLLKKWMVGDPGAAVEQVTAAAGAALRSGHRVFVAGFPLEEVHRAAPPRLVSRPDLIDSRITNKYMQFWQYGVADFLRSHSASVHEIPFQVAYVVNPLENLSLQVAEGWKP